MPRSDEEAPGTLDPFWVGDLSARQLSLREGHLSLSFRPMEAASTAWADEPYIETSCQAPDVQGTKGVQVEPEEDGEDMRAEATPSVVRRRGLLEFLSDAFSPVFLRNATVQYGYSIEQHRLKHPAERGER